MSGGATALRVVRLAGLCAVASWRAATAQSGGAGAWVATPARPTVGDTVWLQRFVAAPPGWRVQAQRGGGGGGGGGGATGSPVEPLADPVAVGTAGGWLIRYPVVAWAPGGYWARTPPIVRQAPDGRVDSLPRDTTWLRVWSVLPDSARVPAPQPALDLLRSPWRRPLPPLAALVTSAGLLSALVRWRRRAPRLLPPLPHVPVEREVPDGRWLGAGEPKAVAARAAHLLRAAIARAVPAAHEALATPECLAALERARPAAPLRDLREVLTALDQVAFASAHGADVPGLAMRARRLATELAA